MAREILEEIRRVISSAMGGLEGAPPEGNILGLEKQLEKRGKFRGNCAAGSEG